MAIIHQLRRRYSARNEEIVASIHRSAVNDDPSDPKILIEKRTEEIASAMSVLHGGAWRTQVDHDAGFVLVARLLQGSPR